MKLFDPTSTPRERTVTLAPRPHDLAGLRVGLVENTKFNSDVMLRKIGEQLARRHGMTVSRMIRKRSQVSASCRAVMEREAAARRGRRAAYDYD